MKLKRFTYLNQEDYPDCVMLSLMKEYLFRSLDISFDEFVWRHGMLYMQKYKLWDYPVWEVYLNDLICEYRISQSAIEEAVKKAIEAQKRENKAGFEKLMKSYEERCKIGSFE